MKKRCNLRKIIKEIKYFKEFFRDKLWIYFAIIMLIFISTGAVFVYPYLYSEILRLTRLGDLGKISLIFFIIISLSIILYILDYFRYKLYFSQNNKVILRCKCYIYNKVLDSNLHIYQKMTDSEIVNRIESDVSIIINAITEISISILTYVFSIVTLIVIMLNIFPEVAVLIFILSLLMVVVTKYYGELIYKKQKILLEKVDRNTMFLLETLRGITDILPLGIKENKKDRYKNLNQEVNFDKVSLSMKHIISNKIIGLLGLLSIILVYVFGSLIIIKFKKYDVELIVAMAGYAQLFISDVTAAVNINIDLGLLQASMDRLKELLNNIENESMKNKAEDEIVNISSIEFKNVSFGYRDMQSAISNVSLSIDKGQKVAFIGDNGSGKSTLAKLLLKFYNAYEGEINVNGVNLNEISSESFYKQLSVVNQNPVLFNGTVEDNLLSNTLQEKLEYFLRMLGITNDFLYKDVGYMGENLSSGEKQKVAILRILIQEHDLYILDEYNNHLDYTSLNNLKNYLLNELVGKTVICITHNYDKLEDFDRVFKFSQGKLESVSDS